MYTVRNTLYNLIGKYKKEELYPIGTKIDLLFTSDELPNFLIVDKFYEDPMKIREFALQQEFYENSANYKGKRSNKFLFPLVKERFEQLLGTKIINWIIPKSANGCFQITDSSHPLVYHSDKQSYAAAIYLTPGASMEAGTSFWRDKKYKCRTSPFSSLERDKFNSDEERDIALSDIYNSDTILNSQYWELVDKVAPLFNRLVIWNGRLIHSASSYKQFGSNEPKDSRLVQLFFFDVVEKI